jgi:hypothetical protein
MPQTQAKAPEPGRPSRLRRAAVRSLTILAVGAFMVWVVQRSTARLDQTREPAGFTRGLLHGALMPMAMTNLMLGQDVTIYSSNNQGRLYKLGYTMGVNGCGALFFGFAFWRVGRWRKLRQPAPLPATQPAS